MMKKFLLLIIIFSILQVLSVEAVLIETQKEMSVTSVLSEPESGLKVFEITPGKTVEDTHITIVAERSPLDVILIIMQRIGGIEIIANLDILNELKSLFVTVDLYYVPLLTGLQRMIRVFGLKATVEGDNIVRISR